MISSQSFIPSRRASAGIQRTQIQKRTQNYSYMQSSPQMQQQQPIAPSVNEILHNLISDLQRLNPGFLNLSPEQQTAFLLDNMRQIKQGGIPETQFKAPFYSRQSESVRSSLEQKSTNLRYLSPMHIINHFNITINHPLIRTEGVQLSHASYNGPLTNQLGQTLPGHSRNQRSERRSVARTENYLETGHSDEDLPEKALQNFNSMLP